MLHLIFNFTGNNIISCHSFSVRTAKMVFWWYWQPTVPRILAAKFPKIRGSLREGNITQEKQREIVGAMHSCRVKEALAKRARVRFRRRNSTAAQQRASRVRCFAEAESRERGWMPLCMFIPVTGFTWNLGLLGGLCNSSPLAPTPQNKGMMFSSNTTLSHPLSLSRELISRCLLRAREHKYTISHYALLDGTLAQEIQSGVLTI